MAWTQADLDRLNSAISNGARSVQYSDGKKIEYYSLEEMLRLRDLMQGEISGTNTGASGRMMVLQPSKGF